MAQDFGDSTPPSRASRTVLVVEDEPLLRDLVASFLRARGFEVVGVSSPTEARKAFHAIDPDAIVMDVDLGPGPTGFDLAEALLEEETGVAIVFLTNMPDPRFAGGTNTRIPDGVAYLHKRVVMEVDTLVEALESALQGRVRAALRHDLDPNRPMANLTAAQIDVLRMVALGRSNAQIAAVRGISTKAVESMIARIFTQLGKDEPDANTRVVLAREFVQSAGYPVDHEGGAEA